MSDNPVEEYMNKTNQEVAILKKGEDIIIKKDELFVILYHLKNYQYINHDSVELSDIIKILQERLK